MIWGAIAAGETAMIWGAIAALVAVAALFMQIGKVLGNQKENKADLHYIREKGEKTDATVSKMAIGFASMETALRNYSERTDDQEERLRKVENQNENQEQRMKKIENKLDL